MNKTFIHLDPISSIILFEDVTISLYPLKLQGFQT